MNSYSDSRKSQNPPKLLVICTYLRRSQLFPVPVETHSSVSVGSFVAHRYELVRLLGQGSRGVVYEALDRELRNHKVALKFLLSDSVESDSDIRALRREVLNTRKINHPHVVQVFEFALTKSAVPYIVLEYVGGGSLRELCDTSEYSTIGLSDRITIFREICLGIEAAHQAGIVHRDIKPENILLTRERRVKVTDFGFARLMDAQYSLSRTEDTIGTPLYMAPEQFQGMRANALSDIYSLGVIAFEMFSGKRASDADSFFALAVFHLKSPFPLEQLQNNDTPKWLEAVISRCIRKDPKSRYSSVRELLGEIETHASSDAIEQAKEKGKALYQFQRTEARLRKLAKIKYYLRKFTRLVLPLSISLLVILCHLNDRAAGNAATLILPVEKYFNVNLTVLSQLFSVPWSFRRPQDIFTLVDHNSIESQRMVLEAFAKLGAADNIYNNSGDTPLTYAVRHGISTAVATLVQHVDTSRRNLLGENALALALNNGDRPTISIVATYSPLLPCDEMGNNAFQFAFINNYYHNFSDFLTLNYSYLNYPVDKFNVLNHRNNRGQTILHLFALNPTTPFTKELFPRIMLLGADRNALDNNGESVMMLAARLGSVEFMSSLLSTAEEWKAAAPDLKSPPLELPSVNPDMQDQKGRTLLMAILDGFSLTKDHLRLIHQLWNFRPNLELRDVNGDTALGLAVRRGLLDASRELISHGANCLSVNVQNESALAVARQYGQNEVVTMLQSTPCGEKGIL